MILDPNVLTEMVGDDPALHKALLSQFVPQTSDIVAEVDAAFADNSAEAVGALGHKLKSSARYMGAIALGDICEALQNAGEADDWAEIQKLVPQLHDVFDQTVASIESTYG